jgi:hypothetical protein
MKLITYFAYYRVLLLSGFVLSCHQDRDQKQNVLLTNPDGVTHVRISQFFMDTQDSLVYNLTEDSIMVVWERYDKDQPDSVIFKRKLTPTNRFSALDKIEFKKRSYHNTCAADGLMLFIEFWGAQGRKQVYLTNYYLPLIDQTIKLVNTELPVEQQLIYDKDGLMEGLRDCNRIDINEPPEGYPYPTPPPPPIDLPLKESK